MKSLLDWAQIIAITISWARFISFFLVIQSVSKLLMTLAAMISSMGTFMLTLAFYLVLVSPLFMILYQTESIAFVDSFSMFRSLVDSVLGNFGYYVTTTKALQFQIII